jgi:superfamily II DNA helicase RecQ
MVTNSQIATAAVRTVMPLIEELQKKNQELEARIKKLEMSPALFNALKHKRKELATQYKVPVYLVATNQSLQSLIDINPTSIKELENVYGFGEYKINRYGYAFLNVLAWHSVGQRHG